MYLEKQHPPSLSLRFSVSGKPVVLFNFTDKSLALKIYIERALYESASARPVEDYDAFYNSRKLDWGKKISSYKFPDNAVIMISLKSAAGANTAPIYDKNELPQNKFYNNLLYQFPY